MSTSLSTSSSSSTTTTTTSPTHAPQHQHLHQIAPHQIAPLSDDDLDWEEYDGSIPFVTHMIAGSIAGIAEHTLMYPMDTIKTHMQCARCPNNPNGMSNDTILTTLRNLIKSEAQQSQSGGFMRLWRGVHTMFIGCVPAHALYFSSYEYTKKAFSTSNEQHQPIAAAASGAIATLMHDSIMSPLDTVKQRLQLGYYNGLNDCVKSMYKTEGLRSFYRSFPLTLAMNLPYGMIMVASNESLKKVLNPSGEFDLVSSMMAGMGAGGVAAAATIPMDNVKTRLQTQELVGGGRLFNSINIASSAGSGSGGSGSGKCKNRSYHSSAVNSHVTSSTPLQHCDVNSNSKTSTSTPSSSTTSSSSSAASKPSPSAQHMLKYSSGYSAFKSIVSESGMPGLFKGLTPRLLTHMPAVAISWTAYEFMKKALIDSGF